MSVWLALARLATVVNVALLLVLGGIWVRNYWRLRSKHTLGLLVFAALLCAENAFALYVYTLDPVLTVWFGTAVPDPAWRAMVAFHALETVGLGALTRVTLD
ncbi:hypothetical protein [Haloarcula nitratireducens]|uniref:Uncharacterized protein n=1 Tax=Haloarcula nitratireducens TaxID=2487749 RepID=A0AAW4PCN8_9EURY|nr:hypothetical protein [Halomicroarcula nitratireducens]MBX0295650.1 hypothetical protein [Halomicroarcula nitratireducens]